MTLAIHQADIFQDLVQSFDVSPDNGVLYQATNVENFGNKKTIKGVSYNLNDVRVGTLPLNGTIYEAEKAKLSNVKAESAVDASNGQEVVILTKQTVLLI